MEKDFVSTGNVSRDSNLLRYCTMGVGTAVLAGTVTTMDASVVYTNFGNTVLTDATVGDGEPTDYEVYLGSNGTFNISSTDSGSGLQVANFFVDTEGSGSTTNFAVVTAGTSSFAAGTPAHALNVIGIAVAGASSHVYNYPSRLAAGVSVGPGGKFITLSGTAQSLVGGSLAFGAGFTNSKWAKNGKNSGYLGISFLGTDNMTHYGFLQFTVATNTAANPRAITLIGAGYQTTANTAITTAAQPAAPEPTSLALLAVGGVGGIAAFRRRKNKKAAEAAALPA